MRSQQRGGFDNGISVVSSNNRASGIYASGSGNVDVNSVRLPSSQLNQRSSVFLSDNHADNVHAVGGNVAINSVEISSRRNGNSFQPQQQSQPQYHQKPYYQGYNVASNPYSELVRSQMRQFYRF